MRPGKCFATASASAVLTLFFAFAATAGTDLALYTGPSNTSWIGEDAVRREADEMIAGLKGMFDNVVDYGDGGEEDLGEWAQAHTGNEQIDVIILACGTTPGSLYPLPNQEPNGSVVEEFINDGNVLINIGDWIFFLSYEGGDRQPDNGSAGAANIFNIPNLTFGGRSNNMIVNENGKEYLPSLEDFTTGRPWHVEQFKGTDWEVTTFAEDGPNDADPAVAVNSVTGGVIAAVIQKEWPLAKEAEDNRGEVVIELVKNWMTENLPGWADASVEPAGKLGVTWGEVKNRF